MSFMPHTNKDLSNFVLQINSCKYRSFRYIMSTSGNNIHIDSAQYVTSKGNFI